MSHPIFTPPNSERLVASGGQSSNWARSRLARFRLSVLIVAISASVAWHVALARAEQSDVNGEISGAVTVIDGDTLELDGQLVKLFGIDAPEFGQFCMKGGKSRWRCGLDAALALKKMVNGQSALCTVRAVEETSLVAVCRVGNMDLADVMLRRGYVIATSSDIPNYVEAERSAKAAGLGLWRGDFVEPSAWREGNRLTWDDGGPAEICEIKGITSDRGNRIYYVPGDPQYDEVTVSADDDGGRWFCSDDEARFAGWKHYGK